MEFKVFLMTQVVRVPNCRTEKRFREDKEVNLAIGRTGGQTCVAIIPANLATAAGCGTKAAAGCGSPVPAAPVRLESRVFLVLRGKRGPISVSQRYSQAGAGESILQIEQQVAEAVEFVLEGFPISGFDEFGYTFELGAEGGGVGVGNAAIQQFPGAGTQAFGGGDEIGGGFRGADFDGFGLVGSPVGSHK